MTESTFLFQRPGAIGSTTLQALGSAATGALGGGAIFAWATKYGLESLIRVKSVEEMLERQSFRIVIGTDAITDRAAVETARQLMDQHPNLNIQFLVNQGGSLFHPKLSWFLREDGLYVLIGSGNLTRGGMTGNWEAAAVQIHPAEARADLEASLDDWLSDIEPGVVDIDDPRLVEAIVMNSGDERQIKSARAARGSSEAALLAALGPEVESWLIAELSKNRRNKLGQSLFSQSSFDQATFVQYFGYAGSEFEITLLPVDSTGEIGALETATGRYKAVSKNWYFELATVSGVPYPSNGRPIAVFGRMSSGGYLYQVILPGQTGHARLTEELEARRGYRADRMRRMVVSGAEFEEIWPDAPILNASDELRG